ncbi:sensor histidine kinase [Chromobacterium vaccinii]|uniref:sensor histidine kinase n=1 Tax=Chromobacterium vaccinii TaxID=1108595 RepID=UPI003CC7EDDE
MPGAVRIQAGVENGRCYLRVEDEGPGMPDELAQCVLEAFRRGDDARQQGAGGSCLGLAVVVDIVHAHGGEAVCGPGAGGGTRFELNWPEGDHRHSS